MAIFKQIPGDELGSKYTHYGWFAFCPVYLGDIGGQAPVMAERNWIPEWWLAVNEFLHGQAIFVMTLIDPEYQPMWMVRISGPIV